MEDVNRASPGQKWIGNRSGDFTCHLGRFALSSHEDQREANEYGSKIEDA
jgi:hypothetical protein